MVRDRSSLLQKVNKDYSLGIAKQIVAMSVGPKIQKSKLNYDIVLLIIWSRTTNQLGDSTVAAK